MYKYKWGKDSNNSTFYIVFENLHIYSKKRYNINQVFTRNDVIFERKLYETLLDTSCRSDIYSNFSQKMISLPNHISTCQTENYYHSFITCTAKIIHKR